MKFSNILLLAILFLSVQVSWTMTKVKQNPLALQQKHGFLSKLAPEMMKNHKQDLKAKIMMKKQDAEFFEYSQAAEVNGDIQDSFKNAAANIQDRGTPSLEDYQNWSDQVSQFIQSYPYDDYPSFLGGQSDE